jgi:hypothetical protein
MKAIHEIRLQQAWQAQKSAGPLPIILGAVIALGIGLLGASGIIRVPTLSQARMQIVTSSGAQPATIAINTTMRRVGNAENAILLRTCVPFARFGLGDAIEHGRLYRMLQTASGLPPVSAMAGNRQKSIDDAQSAAIWAEAADCIYQQNSWMLCDPDNRALAAETASTFIRRLTAAEKTEQFVDGRKLHPGLGSDRRSQALQQALASKGRVLSGIRAQVAEGRLTETDFGLFAPFEITQIARETRVARDVCAGEK